jgi:Rod binding domain-containing protein
MIPSAPYPTAIAVPPRDGAPDLAALRRTAESLEAHFLAEVLKTAGLHSSAAAFGGGAGEEQFSSFLRQAQAEKIAAAGGVGLAEAFFRAMAGHAA